MEGKVEINPPLIKNIGNISRGSCKSSKQMSAHARVCLLDLQVPREFFPAFLIKGRLIYSDFFHCFGNGTSTNSIGKNSVMFSSQLGKKRCFPLKLGKFHHQSEIGYKTLASKTNTIKLLHIHVVN